MATFINYIDPVVDQSLLGQYHQTLAWQISESDWGKEGPILLNINIPKSFKIKHIRMILFPARNGNDGNRNVTLSISRPLEMKLEDIRINAKIKFKRGSEEIGQLSLGNSYVDRNDWSYIMNYDKKLVLVNPFTMKLFDETRSFTLEAEIVIHKVSNATDLSIPNELVKDLVNIFNSEETSDVDVVCVGKVFKCHRNILCARSMVFKSILLGDTQENVEKKVEIKDTTVEAVEEMLKYIYTGKIPEDEQLNSDLLQLADMYVLDTLKIACGEGILAKLNISNCIPSYIMIDRFFTPENRVRNMLDLFMRCKARQVVDSDEWDELSDKLPGLTKDLVKVMVDGGKDAHGCWYCNKVV